MQLFYEYMMQWKRKAKEGRKKIRSKGLAKDEKKKRKKAETASNTSTTKMKILYKKNKN